MHGRRVQGPTARELHGVCSTVEQSVAVNGRNGAAHMLTVVPVVREFDIE